MILSASKMLWFSNFSVRENHLKDSLKQLTRSPPRVCDAIGQGLRICILNKFVGAAAGLGATY